MRRRAWLAAAGGATGLATLGTFAYRAFPRFWQQYARDMQRPILPPAHRPRPELWPDRGIYGAWLGHSSVLLKVDGTTILTDPVFSDRIGIDLWLMTLGLKRMVEPALPKPPRVDLVLLSHAHFDHFDIPTLRTLENRQTRVITAYRTSDLLRVDRYREVRELQWGERAQVGPVTVRAVEVNHWGARMRTDHWRGYNAYLLEVGRWRILFGGDTAITPAFRPIKGSRPVDLAIMPIGAYNPWIRYHCTPEQAWQMGSDAGADRFVPVHHQTFQLSSEPYLEPIERFHGAAGSNPARVMVQTIGQEFRIT